MADSFSANRRPSIRILLLLAGLVSTAGLGDCAGQTSYSATPNYYPHTIARPQDRAWIRNLPIEQRPDRPLHFYGNRVRRSHSVQRPRYSLQPQLQTPPIEVAPLQRAPAEIMPFQTTPGDIAPARTMPLIEPEDRP